MQIERIELKNGWWAEAHHRPSHGQMKQFYRSYKGKSEDELMETQSDLILILVDKWGNKDGERPRTKDAIDETPQDVVTELTNRLSEIIGGDTEVVGDSSGN